MKPQEFIWKTSTIIRETADTVTVVFNTQGQSFSFLPGQFINLAILIDGAEISRSYSLCSSPDEESPAITVKKVSGGVVSNYIVEHAEEINSWKVDGPHGNFYLAEEQRKAHLVLIAGGSGITPLYSILKYFLKHEQGTVTLLYSSREKDDMIFYRTLKHLTYLYTDRLVSHFFFTATEEISNDDEEHHYTGRMTSLRLKRLIKQIWRRAENTHFYLCGPEGLLQLSERALNDLGIDSAFIHKEYFLPTSRSFSQVELPAIAQKVVLNNREQRSLLQVQPGNTILEAALEEKIGVPYSCKAGTCGKCVAKLLGGNVHMKQNYALDKELLNQGYILLCQSHPLANDVTIRIG
ncbi:MAG TPA: ferredoxin--NADP reductase [Chitinophagaceae bacterium]|nr:ferredoxin--NADP reductase [Chitinophagaceae bacterium]